MHKTQKILTTVLWALMVLVMVTVISAGLFRPPAAAAPKVIAVAPSFNLIDQNGQPLTSDTLKGKVWVADFIFTHCAGPCRDMTRRMADLQKELNDPSVQFLSISVDPKRDTPEKLKAFGDEFGADAKTWKFATGESDRIQELARGMLIGFQPAKDDQPIIHAEYFILVDEAGKIRSKTHPKDPEEMKQFLADIRAVAEQAR